MTHRIEWSRDDSEFESPTPSESDDSSSGYESMIPEDLDLYEDGCCHRRDDEPLDYRVLNRSTSRIAD